MLILVGIALTAFSLLAGLRYGSRSALPLVGLVCVVSAIGFEPALGLAPVMGLVAVLQLECQQSFGRIVAMAAAPAAGLSLWQVLQVSDRAFREERAAVLLEQVGALGMITEADAKAFVAMVDAILRAQPAFELATLLLTFILGYRLSRSLAPRLELGLPAPLPLPLWRPWEELIWVLVGALALGLLADGWLIDLALNIAVVMAVLYGTQGVAVLRFFARRQGVPLLVELIFYLALLLVAGLAFLILAGIGLLDTWFDWRRLRPAAAEEQEEA